MKKLFLLLSILCLSAGISLSSTDDQVIPIHTLDDNANKGRNHRGFDDVPIHAMYEESSATVRVFFLQNLGEVDVFITNISTGFFVDYTVQSNTGYVELPLNGVSGYYFIEFYTSGGTGYIGEFQI